MTFDSVDVSERGLVYWATGGGCHQRAHGHDDVNDLHSAGGYVLAHGVRE